MTFPVAQPDYAPASASTDRATNLAAATPSAAVPFFRSPRAGRRGQGRPLASRQAGRAARPFHGSAAHG